MMAGPTREDKRVSDAFERGYQAGKADKENYIEKNIRFVRQKANRHWSKEKILDEIEKQLLEEEDQ